MAEINNVSVLGLLDEIIVDGTSRGEGLKSNIVVVAACNPVGRGGVSCRHSAHEVDLGREWISGFKWGAREGAELIWRRVQKLRCVELSAAMTELVAEAYDCIV